MKKEDITNHEHNKKCTDEDVKGKIDTSECCLDSDYGCEKCSAYWGECTLV